MEFFIAVTSLLTVAAAYLLYQFHSRAFVSDGSADGTEDIESAPESLKAA